MSKQQHSSENERGENSKEVSAITDEAKQESTHTDQDESQEQDENDIETLKQALETQTRKAADNLDKMLRVRAEMENLRKRTLKEVENAHKYALKEFVNELLPALDSLELGLSALGSADNIEDIHEGTALTLKKFIGVMEKFGIKVIDPSGEKFNPEQHEAVSMQTGQEQQADVVVTVIQKGYQLNDRLLRPARVIVAK